jgi:hypothetical protein
VLGGGSLLNWIGSLINMRLCNNMYLRHVSQRDWAAYMLRIYKLYKVQYLTEPGGFRGLFRLW